MGRFGCMTSLIWLWCQRPLLGVDMFEEYTEAEKGFGRLWVEKIEPGLGLYGPEYEQKRRNSNFAWGVLAATGVVLYIFFSFFASEKPTPPELLTFLGICVVGGGLAIFLAWPFIKLKEKYAEFLQGVVAEHFGHVFKKPEDDNAARETAHRLNDMKMVYKTGTRKYTNNYLGQYRDCDINMFNLEITESSSTGKGQSKTSYNYWIVEIAVPVDFQGEVQIRRDYGRILNKARNLSVKGKQVKFSHEAFEKKYEVYAEDPDLAYQLISPAFCNNLLAIDALLPRGWFGRRRPITGLFQNGKFALVVNDFGDVFETDSVAPTEVENAARRIIARMNLPLEIVDYLHGDR